MSIKSKRTKSVFITLLTVAIVTVCLICLFHYQAVVSWTIVAIAIVYGLKITWKYGRIWWRRRSSEVARQERFLLLLVSLMFLFFATGTALHLWAFTCEYDDNINPPADGSFYGGPFSFVNAEYLLRSLVCSFQLFAANIDSNVLDGIRGHEYIKGLISLQAVLSFSCTVAVLISLAFARLKAYFKFHRHTAINEKHAHLYVFFGINTPSRMLAKSIGNQDERSILIFVENNRLDDEDQNGWNNIVGLFTHRRQTFAEVEDLNARVTFSECRLCNVYIEGHQDCQNVLEEMNLMKLREYILKLTRVKDAEAHFFLLSEDEEENIRSMSVLAQDSTINQVHTLVKSRFYCHARINGLNRVVEDIAVKRGLEVRIVDSSHLSIELLKANSVNHPVQLVELDNTNPTTVKSEFNSLIVGFDEAGQDSLRFLYEFGAFVDSHSEDNNVMRSPFHCVAVDRRMDELRGMFTNYAPAAMSQRNSRDYSRLIELKTCDCTSEAFYKDILQTYFCRKLNYVVIALGDDEQGMSLAIRMLNHIRKVREDLSRLRIYVRSYRHDKETYMQRIADHYNEGYNKDCRKEEYQTDQIIVPFGQMEKIYSFNTIVHEELTRKGKMFQEKYAKMKGDDLWDVRRKLLTGVAKKLKATKELIVIPLDQRIISLKDLRSLRRKEAQDLANALHADTKLYLLKKSFPETFDWEDFIRRYFDANMRPKTEGAYDKIHYIYLDNNENKRILNLARLEHLRWNASHEMLGYTKGDSQLTSCDERTLQHNCLRPWHELDEEGRKVSQKEGWEADYKSFDFGVVDITIMLNTGNESLRISNE